MDGDGFDVRSRRRTLIVTGERVGKWVARQTEGVFERTRSTAIGLEREGRIIAGVIYEGWNGKSVLCHWAIRGRATREFLWYIHHYAFMELGAYKVIAPVSTDNVRMMALAPKMGFIEEGRLVDTTTEHLALFTLTADHCRYLGNRYGIRQRTKTTDVA